MLNNQKSRIRMSLVIFIIFITFTGIGLYNNQATTQPNIVSPASSVSEEEDQIDEVASDPTKEAFVNISSIYQISTKTFEDALRVTRTTQNNETSVETFRVLTDNEDIFDHQYKQTFDATTTNALVDTADALRDLIDYARDQQDNIHLRTTSLELEDMNAKWNNLKSEFERTFREELKGTSLSESEQDTLLLMINN